MAADRLTKRGAGREGRRKRKERDWLDRSLQLNPLENDVLSRELQEAKETRWRVGALTFFNRLPKAELLPVVEPVPFTAKIIHSAFVSGFSHPTLPPGTYSGAVYGSDRKIVPEFLEYDAVTQHRVPRRVNVATVEEARVEQAARLNGTCVYLGLLHFHFGHFLLESLPRAWYLEQAEPDAVLLFHGHGKPTYLPPFAAAIFDALAVDPERIRVAGGDLKVDRLILPASQYWQGIKASPGMCVVFDRIREKVLRARPKATGTPPRVYFTRRNLGAQIEGAGPRRAIENEVEAEAFFRRLGYEVVAPEMLPFDEQVAIAANATHIAGPSGSALHLVLFNDNPATKLIELRTKPAVNQLLISAIRGNQAFHVWSAAAGSSPQRTSLDVDLIERAMRDIG
jgi:capsular polysaccharide biosynthesis protein